MAKEAYSFIQIREGGGGERSMTLSMPMVQKLRKVVRREPSSQVGLVTSIFSLKLSEASQLSILSHFGPDYEQKSRQI